MKKSKNFINELILECEIDSRINDGVFDIYNVKHLSVLVERIVELGISEKDAEDMIEKSFVDEGKYPDRQAYNKDGWLVTFPSKEYRDRAIKKRTHSMSDPTHGKGGMNLYYKSKGKQKRQSSQAPTAVSAEPKISNAPLSKKVTTPAPKVPSLPVKKTQDTSKPQSQQTQPQSSDDDEDYVDFASEDEELEKYLAANSGPEFKSKFKGNAPDDKNDKQDIPTAGSQTLQQPSAPTSTPVSYAELSKKFIAQKRWTQTPYGEYRDEAGATAAVVGLSGEVVPIKNVDREEFKIFAEKNPM